MKTIKRIEELEEREFMKKIEEWLLIYIPKKELDEFRVKNVLREIHKIGKEEGKKQTLKEVEEVIGELLDNYKDNKNELCYEDIQELKKELGLEKISPKEIKVNNFHKKSQGSICLNSKKLNLEKEKSL